MRNALSLRVVFVASVFVAAEPLTFMLENNDKQWTFREGSAVTLVCKNSPYTGIHEFSFNSTRTFSCLSRTCYTLYDDRGNFSFKYDMDSGVFTWTINRVKMSYDEHLFVCFDGEHKIEHLVKVSKEGFSGRSFPVNYRIIIGISTTVLILAAVIFHQRKCLNNALINLFLFCRHEHISWESTITFIKTNCCPSKQKTRDTTVPQSERDSDDNKLNNFKGSIFFESPETVESLVHGFPGLDPVNGPLDDPGDDPLTLENSKMNPRSLGCVILSSN